MAIIQTKRNRVYAYEPRPDDVLLRVGWSAPGDGDGKHRRTIVLPYQPISTYQRAVDWAVSMADMMVYPIHVVTLNHGDIFNTERWTPFRDCLANMNDQERGELRQVVVSSMCEVMRDCDDPQVRAEAYDILRKLKVIRP